MRFGIEHPRVFHACPTVLHMERYIRVLLIRQDTSARIFRRHAGDRYQGRIYLQLRQVHVFHHFSKHEAFLGVALSTTVFGIYISNCAESRIRAAIAVDSLKCGPGPFPIFDMAGGAVGIILYDGSVQKFELSQQQASSLLRNISSCAANC